LTPIERTKQMLSRKKNGKPDKKQQNKKNQTEEKNNKPNSDDKKKLSNKKPMQLNKDYKTQRNNQPLKLGETTKKNNRDKISYGVHNVGEGEDIDPKQKRKPIRSPQNLDIKKSRKVNKDEGLDIKEGVSKKSQKNYKSVLYDEYDVERNRGIESVEQKKRDRKIDNELS
ncbi:hypothetical protein ACFQ4Z_20435, partial [Oceanobacillus oncorhynchi subsp. oncorhynchi]|uniref:hypothetical protein n=1 Tax=Oceanobacillus oncorhynchi TaxID=545501 RepID=UPI00363C6388